MLKDPTPNPEYAEQEREILELWEKNNVFNETLNKNKGEEEFVFFEGPPTANGKPHIGHLLGRSLKDLYPRYKTMRGYHVDRKAGWDSHGLPVELEIEKELGISGKQQIEEFGIEKFNDLCRASVFRHIDTWNRLTERMGFWVDLQDPYIVLDPKYIESLWWILKKAWDKDLLKKDYKVVPYCPRCQTPISSHELAQGYKDDVDDPSIFVLFKAKDSSTLASLFDYEGDGEIAFMAWTTTPWTLLGNVALAVDPNALYVLINHDEKGKIVLAKDRLEVVTEEYEVLGECLGEQLLGQSYQPLFSYITYEERAHYIVSGDFVSMEDGTGIVHTAVMYGEDDFKLGTEHSLPKKHLVDVNGTFIDETQDFAGKQVWSTTKEVIQKLEEQQALYRASTIKHTYPYCWRCKSKLIYYALDSWFLLVSKVKDQLIENNESVNWNPSHLKEGRMGDWLRNIKDWSISRWRYWGTPLPIWKCNGCGNEECIGSFEELRARSIQKIDTATFDPHRPYIDNITFECPHCQAEMKRYEDVLDTWFDSGGMPYAQWHYPFENQEKFDAHYPADFVCEAIDQTRGWFYTLLAEATLLGKPAPYKTVLCTEMVLDSTGKKMSKSIGNVIDPFEILDEFGADITRWYFYATSQIGKPYRTSKEDFSDVKRRFFNILWNSYRYIITNAIMDDWTPEKKSSKEQPHVLDQWILSKTQHLVEEVTKDLEHFDAFNASNSIQTFVVNDLSQWYIRRSRDRVGTSSEDLIDKSSFYKTSYEVLQTLTKVMAPFCPFISETMYQNLRKESDPLSVHLEDWPEVKEELKQPELEKQMELVRLVAEKTHALRKESQIKVRQPLLTLTVNTDQPFSENLVQVLLEEVNVKSIEYVHAESEDLHVTLDTTITEELALEGAARDFIREVQSLRKEAGFNLDQQITMAVEAEDEFYSVLLHTHKAIIGQKLITDKIILGKMEEPDVQGTVTLNGSTATIFLKTI